MSERNNTERVGLVLTNTREVFDTLQGYYDKKVVESYLEGHYKLLDKIAVESLYSNCGVAKVILDTKIYNESFFRKIVKDFMDSLGDKIKITDYDIGFVKDDCYASSASENFEKVFIKIEWEKVEEE